MPKTTPTADLDKSPSKIKGMFDRIAPKYDFLNHFLSFGLDILWRKRLVSEVLKTNKKHKDSGDSKSQESSANPQAPVVSLPPILDICCGTGDLSLEWRKRLFGSNTNANPRPAYRNLAEIIAKSTSPDEMESNFKVNNPNLTKNATFFDATVQPMVLGLDFSPEMLRIAKEKIDRKMAAAEIVLLEGDALNLPFADATFSITSVAFGLRNMSDPVAGIAEMKRVCVPGGLVAILEFSAPKLPLVTFCHSIYISRILPIFGRLFSKNAQGAYSFLPESVKAFPEGETLAQIMREAGLNEVKYIPLTLGTVTIYLGRKSAG